MIIDLVTYKKNTITVSAESSPTALVTFNTAKPTVSWTPGSGPAWLKINLYELTNIDSLDLTYTGSCTSMKIEYSIDDISWWTLSDIFSPDDVTKSVEADYSSDDIDASFVRIYIDGLTTFILTTLNIRSDIEFQNTEFLSHNITGFYSDTEIDNYPWLPSFTRIFLEMLEKKEEKDMKLFLDSDYTSLAIAKGVAGKLVQLTATDVPLDATIYVWDWDEQISTITFTTQLGSDFDIDGTALYFEFQYNQLSDDSYVWYNVTDGGFTQDDPALSGKTGIQVDVVAADTLTELATKTAAELTGTNIVASSSAGVVTITNGVSGMRISFTENDTTADVSQLMMHTQTLNPLTQVSNTYQHAGTYIPKLILNYDNFQLEFIKDVTTT